MPLVIDGFPEFAKDNESELRKGGNYVYAWFCADWGGVCYYVGKGTKGRYKQTTNRGMAFRAIYEKWNVYPVILEGGLTVEEAEVLEDEVKTKFIFKYGYPVMDGEGNSAALKNRAIREAKRLLREHNPEWREGRKAKETPEFEKFLEKQKAGELTVAECCEQLGISRSAWYTRARAAA